MPRYLESRRFATLTDEELRQAVGEVWERMNHYRVHDIMDLPPTWRQKAMELRAEWSRRGTQLRLW